MSSADPHVSYTPPPPPPPGGGGSFSSSPAEPLRVFFLVSLIVNALATAVWLLTILGVGAATCGLGCLLVFIPAFPCIALVFDAMSITKIGQPPNPASYSFMKTTAIIDIIAGVISVGLVPLVMGILALLHLQKPEVQRHFGVTGF